ncbi:phosphotransferase family protein [Deinococcus aquatilis]|uniref:phosphotransferase family protein n=1 Tax=Deinococcus aquatilis TaxID=519440 RepID=UPI00058C132F|nr:phosphotransferase [Deinococcus aquatilis]
MDLALFSRLLRPSHAHHQVVRAWPLHGGVSATVTAVELLAPKGQVRTVVVRQYGALDSARNPNIARDEFRLLETLRRAGLAVPEPLAFDDSTSLIPGSLLVSEFVQGTSEFTLSEVPQAAALVARYLVRLHQDVRVDADTAFLPQKMSLPARPTQPDDTLSETLIRDALDDFWPSLTGAGAVIHGDVWPGNVLWDGGKLAAVIDWEDAGISDSLMDVGNARLEWLFFFGEDEMNELTQTYRARSQRDLSALPLFDLYAALRPAGKLHTWGLDPEMERSMRERHRWFVERAVAALR